MSGYSAVFNCSGCGSPLETQEGTISLACTFCGLIMRLGSPGRILKYFYKTDLNDFGAKFSVEHYLKEKGRPLKYEKLDYRSFHLPFYRFRGMSYALLSERTVTCDDDPEEPLIIRKRTFEQKNRHFDLTVPAFSDESFGLDSLGVRPEVMPLTAFQKDIFPEDSIQVNIDVSPGDAKQSAMAMYFYNLGLASANKECISSEMIGEGLSVIYYPVSAFTIVQQGMPSTVFIDGLNRRVYREIPGRLEYESKGVDKSKAVELNPVQHKCPNCGFDLPVSQVSLFYYCSNCDRSYLLKDDDYVPTKQDVWKYEEGAFHHPFWRFSLRAGETNTVGKFARILTGEIPLVAKSKATNSFYLYVPAFGASNLRSLANLGVRICRVQPELNPQTGSFSAAAEMILPESEALELARFYWNVIRARYRHLLKSQFDFGSCTTGPGELIWLSLARRYGTTTSPGIEKTARYV
jgi:predicted RNA-binding Zn-ribbon protein involved in translation (DUF1610 family)